MMGRRSSRPWVFRLGFVLWTCWLTATVAQVPETTSPPALNIPVNASPDGPIHTLHVYMNLEQIPVLVLSDSHERMKPVDTSKFRVSLDSGPWFKPTHVRVEGDDPISLAVLIDATRPKSELLATVEDAVVGLPLQPRDTVSLYVMGCVLTQSSHTLTAEPERLRKVLDEALQPYRERQRSGGKPGCRPALSLWDAMAYATSQLRLLPGRRVMLAVTDGEDEGSRMNWNQVKLLVQGASVAVFGVLPNIDGPTHDPHTMQGALLAAAAPGRFNAEDPFDSICQLSGGVRTFTGGRTLGKTLQKVMQMVRERYIIEYPRANNDTAGIHSLVVTLDKRSAYVRPAGISMPVFDPKVLADPTTLPSDPSNKPVNGSRRVLGPS